MSKPINIVFDGPPGPDSRYQIGGTFVDVETDDGKSIKIGEWIKDEIWWKLRITELPES